MGGKRKREKALRRKKRKEKKAERGPRRSFTGLSHLLSADAPLYGCWINRGWQSSGVAGMFVARKMRGGKLMFAYFYVEVNGSGLVDCFGDVHCPEEVFRREFIDSLQGPPLMRADISLVRKIVREGVTTADDIGKHYPEQTPQWLRLLGDDEYEEQVKTETSIVERVEFQVADREEVEAELRQIEALEETEDSSPALRRFDWKSANRKNLLNPAAEENRLASVSLEQDKLILAFFRTDGRDECLKYLEAFLGSKIERL